MHTQVIALLKFEPSSLLKVIALGDIIQGGAVNRGLKHFFQCIGLHVIQAYGGPKMYWLVWARPLANHPFNFNIIFLSNGLPAAVE